MEKSNSAKHDRKFFNEKMETMPGEQLEAVRLKRLGHQLNYVYQNSEFYRRKFDDIGAHPNDITDMQTFRKLPIFVNKEIHRESQEESLEKHGHAFGMFVCAPIEKIALISATSGTTGPPTYYLFTHRDLQIQAELFSRQMWRIGCRPGDVFIQGTATSGLYLAGIPVVHYCLESSFLTSVPIGAEAGSKKLLETAIAAKASILFATPSYMQYLIETAPKTIGKNVSELGIRTLIGLGEPGAGLPKVRKTLTEAYRAKLFDAMGPGTNYASISCDSEEYQGMHVVSADYMIHEDLVDPITKEPLEIKDGVIGEQLRTALDKEAGPFIRYSMGDVVQLFTKPCRCGFPGDRIKVIGRADDMLIIKGVNVFPGAIKNVINSFSPRLTGEFRIVLTEPPPRVVPPLRMRVESVFEPKSQNATDLRIEVEEALHTTLRFRPTIEMLPPNSLERTSKKTDWFERLYKSS
jgi:phenylacetate-CoA ligase